MQAGPSTLEDATALLTFLFCVLLISLLKRQNLDLRHPVQSRSQAPGTSPSDMTREIPGQAGAKAESFPTGRSVSTYPHQLLREGPAGVFWHVDGRDDPVPFLPPQPIGALMLWPRQQCVIWRLDRVQGCTLLSFLQRYLEGREEEKKPG